MKDVRNPTYSICMCNYNMAKTLRRSLGSILNQIDTDKYEIVLVDDGSSDNSLDVLAELEQQYSNLRIVKLDRDSNRKLGITRNISIENAKGKYVLLHLDCDDEYGPHIEDFVKVFHQIEESFEHEILLSGKHINMGARDFLLKHGPYRNLFRAEDRDLWIRLAETNAYIPMEHINFVKRLPKSRLQNLQRIFSHTWDQMVYNFRAGLGFNQTLRYELKRWKTISPALITLRFFYFIPAYVVAIFKEPIEYGAKTKTFDKIADYRQKMSGTAREILERQNKAPDFSTFSKNGRKIFDV